jgi:cell division septum initiation protein DivIVA
MDEEEGREGQLNPSEEQDQADSRRQSRFGSRLTEGLTNATDSARKRLQQSSEAISDATDSAQQSIGKAGDKASEQVAEVAQGLQRSGEVLTGADIRKFDEFTEAVTRVCVGLYQDNVRLKEQVTALEVQLEETGQQQARLTQRIAALEGQVAARSGDSGASQEQ